MKTMLVLLLSLAACGSPGGDTGSALATVPEQPPALVVVIDESGGCNWMGPNCRRLALWSDGTAAVFRAGDESFPDAPRPADAADVGAIDRELVAELIDIVEGLDFDELEARLGPGSCQGCVDGIDYRLEVHTESGVRHLSSVEFDFDHAEPFFRLVAELSDAMSATLLLPQETRS